uniref:Potassium channel subfamily K member 9 n=1 Tax=Macrostomum lignano TaxID=282301 RepID=A0A1I8HRM2_9PLAT
TPGGCPVHWSVALGKSPAHFKHRLSIRSAAATAAAVPQAKMRRQNIRTLALIVVTFTYLLVGAVIFDVIESGHEIEARQIYLEEEQHWKTLFNISDEIFENITDLVLKMKPYKASSEQWKFYGAFYFSTTLITTIGYGHSTPKTRTGKVVCMLYSLVGIPLCIVMFQSIGERLNALITFILRSLKRLFRCKNTDVSQTNLIVVSINIGTLVLAAGAALFSHYESWNYLDSVYYCFITLTTVGFGDMVALQKNDQLKNRPDYVLFSLVFIMAGLTVVSSAMNLMVLRFLTMNTEDVRREELEQAAAAREAIRLEGDVINANGSVLLAMQARTDAESAVTTPEELEAASKPAPTGSDCLASDCWCCLRRYRQSRLRRQ